MSKPKKQKAPSAKLSIRSYNARLSGQAKKIGTLLKKEIDVTLKTVDSKVWHGHPVWFLEGNPIVGYGQLKDCVQLLFWSGQSFKEKGLQPEGSFKAAEKRYTSSVEINTKDLRRWLNQAKNIQWDYKNIIKRRGKLVKKAVK